MCIRAGISGLVSLLLALTASWASLFSLRRAGEPFLGRTQPHSSTSPTLSADLDGDGLVDQATLGIGGLQNSIELDLSRAGELAVLQFSPKTGDSGALFARDLDSDGDTDLLWRGGLPPQEVIVWLNDGSGRFECLCLPETGDRRVAIGGAGVSVVPHRRSESVLSAKRNPSPGQLLSYRWDCHAATNSRTPRREQVWTPACAQRPPTDRGPPPVLC